ncbi:acyl-CoA carboxylase subunit beta [Saccharopolyspora gloriosae]|uniref:Acetyl-CoA/propionyl-CoA carboxylase carboxyl transferase subunit n=1 Tax=Saccharopolyspora gloriosae TaxID=455344 RepID=A0A840NPE4_9PSEU|nr:carboxyl transferase domain-containing protein [Saccharopolyspora gloriosae]MBB5070972.1 acetyl-CoA/propionyl-CoA carboxylase carboxyl transferase subunit [Saccharopolyspora gloriosae]
MTSSVTEPAGLDQAPADPRDPVHRMSRLLDEGSLEVTWREGGVAVVVGQGRIGGAEVVVYCTDATRKGGAIGVDECPPIVEAIDSAVRRRLPVIGIWHSGGAKLAEGVAAMDGIGLMFAAMVRASGVVPQLSVVLGPAAGGAAYGPALTDLVIMSEGGRVFVTGPDVVRSVTGEQIDMAGLGGPEAHGAKSGVAHLTTASDEEAFRQARRVTALLSSPGSFDLDALGERQDLRALLPESPKRAYDVRPLVRAILDDGPEGFAELQPKWAPNMVTGLGRLGGRTIGVLANNPLRKGGCLDSLSAEKASRFVRFCDSFGVPLVVLVDVPGYLPGVGQEWGGVVRRGAKLLHAFAEAVVPRVTLVTRKSYGGAYIAMNSRSLGASAVFAWPDAEVAVMSAKAAVGVLHRKRLAAATDDDRPALEQALIAEHERVAGGVGRAMSIGVVDELIDPADTRHRLADALATTPPGRGAHGNIPL